MKPKIPEKLTFMDLACPKNPTRRAFLRDIVVGSGSLLLLNRFLVKQVQAQTRGEKTVFSMIVADFNKCTGCRTCETACSSFNRREIVNGRELPGMGNPYYSNIRVYAYNPDVDVPTTCLMCDDAPCIEACPVDPDPETGWKALYRSGTLPVLQTDKARCIGCGSCAEACRTKRVGAIIPNPETNKPERMCTLCGGDPQCVKRCPYGALSYVVEGTDGKHYGISPDLAAKALAKLWYGQD